MVGKLVAVFGVCLVAAVFLLSGGSVAHQDDSTKRKAIEQMREIADAIKQCPERENSHEDACTTSHFHSGPPTNVEWDVLPSKTVRSPFQGVIEFTVPSRNEEIMKANLPKKQLEYCKKLEQLQLSLQPEIDAKAAELERKHHDGHYRYEFDLGSGAPELVKMLWVTKDANDNTITSPVTSNRNECWIAKAKSVGSAKPENGSPSP